MNLIGDIVNELISREYSLEAPLLKTKVLATRLENPELLLWVNNELLGYPDVTQLPDYRRSNSWVKGSYMNGRYHVTNVPIPINSLNDDEYKHVIAVNLSESVSALERLTSGPPEAVIKNTMSAYQKMLVGYAIKKAGNNADLIDAWQELSPSVILDCISAVRGKLLDFMLQLESTFGEACEIKGLKQQPNVINRILKQTIYTQGDGVVINTGDSSHVSASINITKNDKSALMIELLKHDVSKEDAEQLLTYVDDEPNGAEYSPRVTGWIKSMLSKAVEGTWSVGIGAAGNILATLLQNYYGH